jgi:hypothetical protein
MDSSGIPIDGSSDDHLYDAQADGKSGPADTNMARFSQSDQEGIPSSEESIQFDQDQERLESSHLLSAHHVGNRGPDQQIRDEETMDLRCHPIGSEISRGTSETGRILGLDAGHSDAPANERFSSRVKEGPNHPQWFEVDPPMFFLEEEEEDLDPAPQAPVSPPTEYVPQPVVKPQVTKSLEQGRLVSPVFFTDRDAFGTQIPESSLDQLEAIEEENRRKPPIVLQIRGEQPVKPPELKKPTYEIKPFDSNYDPYKGCIRIPIDFSKDPEPSEDDTEDEIEWDRKWRQGIREQCEKVEFIIFPDGRQPDQWVYWPKKHIFVEKMEPVSSEDDPESMNINRQSSIQETETVETHNLQSSEGQLRKPTDVFKAEVIAAFMPERHNPVFARSDDLLALKAENRLELDLSGKAEVRSCLKEDLGPDFQVSKSKDHPNC